jgi:uncharacterized protein (TIGR02145 family)
VRAYATNSAGTAYGNDITFTTGTIIIPVLATAPITSITLTTATSGGNITSDGGGAILARGTCWSTTTAPTIANSKTTNGTGTGSFVSNLSLLLPGTTYYIRAYATNSAGTAYGNELSFTTNANLPALTTTAITSVTVNSASSGGNITSNGGATVTDRGVCWATTANPTILNSLVTSGTGSGAFSGNLTGLLAGTTYYVRAYATNSAGTAYGNQFIFNTKIADIEGNTYNTVTIGTQVWMSENLKTTRYNNNIAIPNVTDNTVWSNTYTPAYCWFNNDETTYKPLYGAMYNWFTVTNGLLCPTGWHVATEAEYGTLEMFLGMPADQINLIGWRGTDQGSQMKNTTGWDAGQNGTNTSGFSALPGGYRFALDGTWQAIGSFTYWWTGTETFAGSTEGWYRRIDGANSDVYRGVENISDA